MNFSYQKYRNKVPEHLEKQGCSPFNLQLPQENEDKRPLCVVVVGHLARHDIKAEKLLSTKLDREAIGKVMLHARKMAKATGKDVRNYRFAFINFNHHRNYHLKGELRHESIQFSVKRIHDFIDEQKPEMVLVMGDSASQHLLGPQYTLHGIVHQMKIKDRSYPTVPTLEMAAIICGSDLELSSKEAFAKSNMFFYMVRNTATIFLGKPVAAISKIAPKAYLVDTIKKFDKMMADLEENQAISCDTETTSLEVIDVRILTIQFATSVDFGYVLPLGHTDSPWDAKQLTYIRQRLVEFFTQPLLPWSKWKKQKYLITQYGQYDLRVIRQDLKIPYVTLPVWDLIAGEHLLDENLSELKATGSHVRKPYSLDVIAARYGNLWYYKAKFSKSERATIKDASLDENVLEYCAMDVQIPLGIHMAQQRIAQLMEHEGGTYHATYVRLMLAHMTNMTHVVSTMKLRGMPLDLNYLMELCDKTRSPLIRHIDKIDHDMKAMPSVQATNQKVLGETGAPTSGLFGKAKQWLFSITKPMHKKALFLDVLGLEPISQGANGAKFDKPFQKKYEKVPEIAIFMERSKVTKLYQTYAKGLFSLLKNDRDFKTDQRVRPTFDYRLVTGRTSCVDPNLQNIPQHSDLAKLIKRMFIASPGTLHIKYDFSAHEVRFWGIMSGDSMLLGVFDKINKMIFKFRGKKKVTPEDRAELELADVHKMNYNIFTGVPLKEITKVQRQSSKAIGFGAIYGKSVKTMAKDLGKTEDEMNDIYNNFFSKFKKAKKKLDDWCKQALTFGYVSSPIGRRRNMWAGVLGYDRCKGDVKRRAQNSPVQGIASDAAVMASRLLELAITEFLLRHKLMKKNVPMAPVGVCAMVHDSTEVETPYEMFFITMWIMEYIAITGVRKYFKEAFDYELGVDLAIEFEVGSLGDKMRKWDWTKANLKEVIYKALEDQRDVLRYKLDVDETFKSIYKAGRKWAPVLAKEFPLELPPINELKDAA